MKIIKWLLLCGVALNVGVVWACPTANPYFNKKITPWWKWDSRTIFFCKEVGRDSDTEYKFGKHELIQSTPGEAAGNARYIMGSSEGSESLATGTAELTLTNPHGSLINSPNTDPIIALNPKKFSQRQRTWTDRTLFHFYKRGSGCGGNWRLSNSIRTYLQENAHIFTAKAPGSHTLQEASRDGEFYREDREHSDARVAIIDNVILSHKIDKTKTITGKMEFYWIHQSGDDDKPKGLGGAVGSYCHFGIAVNLTIKNTVADNGRIDKAGDYLVTVGVRTQ